MQACRARACKQLLLSVIQNHAVHLNCDATSTLSSIHMQGVLTYVLSWRTKLEKLLCLKCLGRRSRENSGGFHTTKLAGKQRIGRLNNMTVSCSHTNGI